MVGSLDTEYHEHRSWPIKVSPVIVHDRPDHSISNHLSGLRLRFNTLPLSMTNKSFSGIFKLHLWIATRCPDPAESKSSSTQRLRTGRSSSVAPHITSRWRSYSWIRARERLPGKDFHLSDYLRSWIPAKNIAGMTILLLLEYFSGLEIN